MKTALIAKIKESVTSVMPVTILVLIAYFTPFVSIEKEELVLFLVSTVFLVLGIALFNNGADLAMTPMGSRIGTGLMKSGRLGILLPVAFLMGLFITIAEPDLSVLANQVGNVINPRVLTVTIGIGVGSFLLLGVSKIVFNLDHTQILMLFYMFVFAFTALVFERGKNTLLPLCFDAGGVTTGPVTVPFIMALGVGISRSVGGRKAQENSFGLVALCSVGPILAMLVLSLFSQGSISYTIPDFSVSGSIPGFIAGIIIHTVKEVFLALALIVIFFLILQVTVLKMSRLRLIRIFAGIIYTFTGLVMFLSAVSVGYMSVGYKIGVELASTDKTAVIIFAFVLGMVTVLAEPAIHVLNNQVEEVTNGNVKKIHMMTALSFGVGISVGLSVLRAYFGFSLLYYLIPGYLLSLGLSFFVPRLYTAIAFDSGGVASGPLTSGFVLPMVIGACSVFKSENEILEFAFGIVAMVAMTPLIAIQLLGFRAIVAKKARDSMSMKRIFSSDDNIVVNFDWSDKGIG
ncbi:MAG: DUF1538 domain-containing protein [Lachnospiraceae bacterium]|nr:DUF1538 domain-containing protein [Lachnospiraceae bacterium]